MKCVNIHSEEFVALKEATGLSTAKLSASIGVWQDQNNTDAFPDVDTLMKHIRNVPSVSYQLKAVDILSSKKAEDIFAKGQKNNWPLDKILTELQVPKEQKRLILDSGKTDREQIITDLLANYSYTVEINTAYNKNKKETGLTEYNTNNFELNGWNYQSSNDNYNKQFGDSGEWMPITKEEFNNAKIEANKEEVTNIPTQHYAILTVPGGTNYTENEIATPAITPSIKGHARFSTDKGIGWFRSDDKTISDFDKWNIEESKKEINELTKGYNVEKEIEDLEDQYFEALDNQEYTEAEFLKDEINNLKLKAKSIDEGLDYLSSTLKNAPRTRRILEVQSDLFQKGRDKKELVNNKPDVILPIGTSGSGKSTFIKSLPQENLVVIEPDAMRVEFTGDMNDKSKDKEIYEEAAKRAIKAIKQGKQVVFDTTNLTKEKRLPFIKAIKKEIPNANIQYKLMPLNPELAKQRIKADIAAGKNRANVPDSTIDRHAESYKQMLEDIKNEPISNYENNKNQFLQLLNKDNNWVTFFIKSIIQDSAKKGYEKVLFPTGDTASKIEGHQTLTEELRRIDEKIARETDKVKKPILEKFNSINEKILNLTSKKEIEKYSFDNASGNISINNVKVYKAVKKGKFFNYINLRTNEVFNTEFTQITPLLQLLNKQDFGEGITKESKEQKLNALLQEKEKINKELENADIYLEDGLQYDIQRRDELKSEGIAKLKPIYNFYENTVTNILKKQGHNPTRITDEYGNTWNEVSIKEERDLSNIYFSIGDINSQLQNVAKKYNIHESGFTPTANVNSIQAKAELKKLGYGLKQARNGTWFMTKSGKFFNPWKPNVRYYNVAGKSATKISTSIPTSSLSPANEAKFKQMLTDTLSKLGFKETAIDEYIQRTGHDLKGVADLVNRMYAIAKGTNSLHILAEETAHIFTSLIPENDPMLNTLLQEVVFTDKYKEVKDKYNTIYNGNEQKIRKEAVDQIISDVILKKFDELSKTPSFFEKIVNFISRVINAFRGLNGVTYAQKLSLYYEDLADRIIKGETKGLNLYPETIQGSFYSAADAAQDAAKARTYKNVIQDVTKNLIKRRDRYSLKSKDHMEFTNKVEELNAILEKLENLDDNTKLAQLLEFAAKDLADINQRLKNGVSLKSISEAKLFVMAYKDLDVFENNETVKDLKEIAARIEDQRREISLKLDSMTFEEVKSFISKTSSREGSEVLSIIENVPDISYDQRWLGALAGSADPILANIDKYYKNEVLGRVNEASQEFMTMHNKLTDKVLAELKKLGIKDKEIFDIFLEKDENGDYTGLIVDKYSFNYYKAKKEAFSKKEGDTLGTQKKRRKEFFNKYHMPSEMFEPSDPKDEFISSQYKVIQANPVFKEYYEHILSTIEAGDNMIPSRYSMGRRLPVFKKTLMERFKSLGVEGLKGLRREFKEGLLYMHDYENNPSYQKDIAALNDSLEQGTITPEDYEISKNEIIKAYSKEITDETNSTINMIPVYGVRELENKKLQSFDISKVVASYYHMALMYSHKSNIQETLEQVSEYLRKRQVNKYTTSGKTQKTDQFLEPHKIDGADTRSYAQFQDWMQSVFYEQEKDTGAIGKYSKQKVAKAMRTYVSFRGLAFNMFAGFANITVGEALQRLEGAGAEFYTRKNYRKASKIYRKELSKIMKKNDSSKLAAFLEYFDVLQDTSELKGGKKTVANLHEKFFDVTKLAFSINHAGEHLMQSRLAIAMALDTKVKDANGNPIFDAEGNEVTLYDAYEIKDGFFRLKEEYKNSDLSDFSTRQKFRNRVRAISQRVHGRYTSEDAAALQRYALGSLAIQFRKWMHSGYENRFRKAYYNEHLETTIEGRYLTLKDFLLDAKNGWRKEKMGLFLSLKESYGNLSAHQKANMKRNLTELKMFVAMYLVVLFLDSIGDDDDDLKDSRFFNFIKYQADRWLTEMRFYNTGLVTGDAMAILKQPAAAVSMVDDIGDISVQTTKMIGYMLGTVEEDDLYFQRGYNKGKLKLVKAFEDIIPFWTQMKKWLELEDEKSFLRR